jgi:hypothetical protein
VERLAGRELVVLQLLAVGYTPAQIDRLLDEPGATGDALQQARAVLGGEVLAWVLAEARRRGLIV